jgi:hypothetical protein
VLVPIFLIRNHYGVAAGSLKAGGGTKIAESTGCVSTLAKVEA